MKFAPMNYHYLRYPIKKFLDKVERSPFNSIDLYCSAPQLNLFDYPLLRLIELKKEIEAHHLSVMAMTPENCVYPVNFCTQDDLTRESSIRYYQRAIDTAQFLDCPCVQISTGSDIFAFMAADLVKKSYGIGLIISYAILFVIGVALGSSWGIGTLIAVVAYGPIIDRLMGIIEPFSFAVAGMKKENKKGK